MIISCRWLRRTTRVIPGLQVSKSFIIDQFITGYRHTAVCYRVINWCAFQLFPQISSIWFKPGDNTSWLTKLHLYNVISEFWEHHFQCRYPASPATPYNQNWKRTCTGLEKLSRDGMEFEAQLQYVSDAVMAFAYAFRSILSSVHVLLSVWASSMGWTYGDIWGGDWTYYSSLLNFNKKMTKWQSGQRCKIMSSNPIDVIN